jgi:hypothetical protein
MGISILNGYRGIRNAPVTFSPIFNEFKPIQDACQSNTPIKMTKQPDQRSVYSEARPR